MTKVKDVAAREYYLRATAELGWSRNVLSLQIGAQAYQRQELAPKQHNFKQNLPESLAEQADLALKDSYALDFLGLYRTAREREIEGRMIACIRDVLLELGAGFCFVGSQFRARWPGQTAGREPEHRHHPVPVAKSPEGGIRAAGDDQTHGRR
jgi:predicted nuclease of restriction endonuclease-like (RecB) superfamily